MSMGHPNILYLDSRADYPVFVRGKGIYLYTADGDAYIDGCSGAISSSLGHGRRDMAEVLEKQAETLAYVHRHIASADVVNVCATKLKENFPAMDRFFMVSGGTEAVEICEKMARLHFYYQGRPQKYKIIGRWMSYHGFSSEMLALGGNPGRRQAYAPYLREDGHVAPPYCYRCWFGQKEGACRFECAAAIEDAILTAGPENVAGVLCETVSGTSLAAVTPPDGYYKKIREICDQYDVLMIMDEVMCGTGRTGSMTAIETYGVVPDIIALAKSIGGGYFPVGVAACTEKTAGPFVEGGQFGAGYTWAGNPLASAVISKTLDVFRAENLVENVRAQGARLKNALTALKKTHRSLGDVRGRGLMVGMEFVADQDTRAFLPAEWHFGDAFVAQCKKHRLIVDTTARFDHGVRGDGCLLGPCFEVTPEEIDQIVSVMDTALGEVEARFGL